MIWEISLLLKDRYSGAIIIMRIDVFTCQHVRSLTRRSIRVCNLSIIMRGYVIRASVDDSCSLVN